MLDAYRISGSMPAHSKPIDYMKKPNLVLSLLFAATGMSFAAPYGPQGEAIEYQQPHGKKLSLRVFGDEYYARTETLEGHTVIFNHADGCYYYAQRSADGQSLESTGIKADQAAPAGKPKRQAIAAAAARKIAQANRAKFDSDRAQRWERRIKAVRKMRDIEAGIAPVAGDGGAAAAAEAQVQAAPVNGGKVGLTVLVQFPDDANTAAIDPTNFPTDQAKISRYCNGVNYTEDGNTGSVRDYFFDQSGGALTYTQSVSQIVTLPNARNYYNYSDYPANQVLRDSGAAGRLVIQHAVAALVTAGFNFSNLSVDGNNRILATNVLFAGQNSGVWSEGLWPHQWSMAGSGINVGTVQSPRYVYGYQITNVANAAPVIGTFCHENGHLLLDYPDLYDYDGDSAGAGYHCLMGGGNHANGGRTPVPINLHFKDLVGWSNVVDLTAASNVTVSLPSTGNVGRRIRKPGSNTELFMVENRGTGDKWAASVPDKGICIWHIDDAKSGNSSQEMTSGLHYQVSLEQADGAFDLENDRDSGDGLDCFDSGDPDFSDITSPDADWWDGTNSGIRIHVTSAAGANMNVEFGNVAPVTLADALDSPALIWSVGGTAGWSAQSVTTHDGTDAANSGDINHNELSHVQTTVTGPATLSFWWKVSSESGYDYLRFYLDGAEQAAIPKISGLVDWTQKTINIPAGSHTLKWEYAKDYSVDSNADTAWLDQVVITKPEIGVEQVAGSGLTDGSGSISCGSAPVGASATVLTVTVKNTGTSNLTGLAIFKDGIHSADFAVSGLGATTVIPGGSTTFTVQFTAGAVGARNAAIHIASNDADENPFDIALTATGVSNLPSGWGSSDIGAVGFAGSASQNGGVYNVSGSGADIYGTADGFQFVSQTLVGDGEIRARVTSQTNTGASAKAGVMIRDGSAAGAVNAMIEVTPSNGFTYQSRTVEDASASAIYGPALNPAPNNWVRLTRSGSLVTAYVSADGTNWSKVATQTLNMANSVSIGLAVTSGNNSVSGTATFDNVAVTPFPSIWVSEDIGTTLTGKSEYFANSYTIAGAGADIYNTADGFRFVRQGLSGDGSIIARVASQQNTNVWAKAGVMIRENLTSGSKNAIMEIANGVGQSCFQFRSAASGTTNTTAKLAATAPRWVRLTRTGNVLTGSISTDGVTWTQVGTTNLAMASEIYIGLAVTSHDNTVTCDAVFDNVIVVP
jgi:M6 family metalloprotease-like protein